EHAHRALHDVGQVLPAHAREFVGAAVQDVRRERKADAPSHDLQRRLPRRGYGLDQRGLARARFARQAVDLVAPHLEVDAIDRAHLALYAEVARDVVGLETLHREHRGIGGLRWRCRSHRRRRTRLRQRTHAALPMRLNRLRGSMYSLSDTANRYSPMNSIITSATGNAIHHQMPAT